MSLGAAAALLALASVGGPAQQAAAEPASYVLMCRGGGPMRYAVYPVAGGVQVTVTFVKSSAAGTVRPPAPGECTWLDRPINRAEPDTLAVNAPGTFGVHCNSAGQCVVDRLPAALQSLNDAVRGGGTFQVHVYNRGTIFRVTRVGP